MKMTPTLEFLINTLGKENVERLIKLDEEYTEQLNKFPGFQDEILNQLDTEIKNIYRDIITQQFKHDPQTIAELLETEQKSINEICNLIIEAYNEQDKEETEKSGL